MVDTARVVGKYGLRPPPLGRKWALKFGDYVDLSSLPPIPKGAFGHMSAVTKPWDIYMNDRLGCCVVSGAQHEHRLWDAEGTGADTVVFTDANTIKNYTLLGNYHEGDPDTDEGCDMLKAAELRIKRGIVDATGKRHYLGIALELDAGDGYINMDQFWYANWLFDGVGLGIGVTRAWQDDFAANRPWDGANYNPYQILGGHYIPAFAREEVDLNGRTNFAADVLTWGHKQQVTPSGLQACVNRVLVYATKEKLHNGKDMNGLGWSDMRSDIRKVVAM